MEIQLHSTQSILERLCYTVFLFGLKVLFVDRILNISYNVILRQPVTRHWSHSQNTREQGCEPPISMSIPPEHGVFSNFDPSVKTDDGSPPAMCQFFNSKWTTTQNTLLCFTAFLVFIQRESDYYIVRYYHKTDLQRQCQYSSVCLPAFFLI